MSDQQRQSFRVEPHLDGELFHEGRVAPCDVINLSAGGARIETSMHLRGGAVCTLGIRLDPELERAAGTPYVSFHMFVLDARPQPGSDVVDYRLQHLSTAASSSTEYETATKVVYAIQRRDLAHGSGVEGASPMATDRPRRRKLASKLKPRFSRGSTRGGGDVS